MNFGFGQPPAAPAKPMFNFGQPAAAAAPSTSTTNPFGQSAAPGTNLFGAQQQQQQPPAPQSNLFGGTSAAPSSSNLFGAAAAPAAATQSAPPLGNIFGGSSQPSSTPSIFGQQQQQQQPQTNLFGGSNIFGQSQQQQSAPQPAVTAAPHFGQSSSAASASLFGPSASTSTSSRPPFFGASTSNPSQPTSQTQPLPKLGDPYPAPNPNEPSIESRLEALKSAWDPSSINCKFQTYFYNVPTPPNTVQAYQSPPPGADAREWRKAIRENPDPEHLIPAIAIGFTAIQKRIESQQRQSLAHQGRLAEIQAHLATLSSTHALTTSLRTLRAAHAATALSARLLALVAKSSALSPNRNQSTRKDEEALRIALDAMRAEVEETKGRGNDLWAGVGALKAKKIESEGTEWAVADEDGLRKIMEILTAQQAGLDHLTKTLDAAADDLDVMNEAFGLKSLHGSR